MIRDGGEKTGYGLHNWRIGGYSDKGWFKKLKYGDSANPLLMEKEQIM